MFTVGEFPYKMIYFVHWHLNSEGQRKAATKASYQIMFFILEWFHAYCKIHYFRGHFTW